VSALLLATLAAALFGALAVALRVALEHGADPETTAAVTAAIGLALALILSLPQWGDTRFADAWPFLLGGALAPGLSQIFFVRAIEQVGAARTAVLFGISPLVAAVPAIVLLDEPLGIALALGMAAIVVGCFTLGWERRAVRTVTALGVVYSLCAAVTIAARDVYARHTATEADVSGLVAAAATLLAGTVVLAVAALVRRRGHALREARWALLLAGLLQGGAYAALLEALTRGRVTVVVPLYTTEALWAVVLAALFLRRRELVGARVAAAAALMVAGGALIGVGR
jgi:drug/metabolite transporter (DMT)-like permease